MIYVRACASIWVAYFFLFFKLFKRFHVRYHLLSGGKKKPRYLVKVLNEQKKFASSHMIYINNQRQKKLCFNTLSASNFFFKTSVCLSLKLLSSISIYFILNIKILYPSVLFSSIQLLITMQTLYTLDKKLIFYYRVFRLKII